MPIITDSSCHELHICPKNKERKKNTINNITPKRVPPPPTLINTHTHTRNVSQTHLLTQHG